MLLSAAKVSSQTRFLMPYTASQRSPDDAFATFPTLRVLSFRICGSGRFTSRFFVSRLWWSNLDLALRKKERCGFSGLGARGGLVFEGEALGGETPGSDGKM